MSHRARENKRNRAKTRPHKTCRAVLLAKFKVDRSRELNDWAAETRPELMNACDLSTATKTVRAYLGVSCDKWTEAGEEREIQSEKAEKEDGNCEEGSEAYCNCKKPYVAGELMFKCEGFCGNWYHPECLKMKTEEVERQKNSNVRWYCPECIWRAKEVMNGCGEGRKGRSMLTTIG
jgi:hypothetical protein